MEVHMTFSNPNIFEFATKELSQDAFICWLIAWSKNTEAQMCSGSNKHIYNASQKFLELLLGKEYESGIQVGDVQQQKYHTDIIVEFTNGKCLLIEDKINAIATEEQVNAYAELIKRNSSNVSNLCTPVLLITGNQDFPKADNIHVVRRSDILKCLDGFDEICADYDIFTDFFKHIKAKEHAFNAWKDTPVKNWTVDAIEGFYSELKSSGLDSSFGYVANPRGGLWVFYFGAQKIKTDMEAYFQMEATIYDDQCNLALYLRASSNDADQTKELAEALRDRLDASIFKTCISRKGKTMRVAEVEFSAFDEAGIISFNDAFEQLTKLEKLKLKI
tara:strand:- start:5778 stop:6773 length:996 start_codon:yes stop_codon:yes gene_type:complete